MWQTIIKDYTSAVFIITTVLIFGKIILQNIKENKTRNNIILFILATIMQFTTYTFLNGTLKSLILFLIYTVFYKKRFNISTLKSILLSFLYMIVLIIPEIIEIVFITNVLKMSLEFCYNTYAGSIIGNFSISIMFCIIAYILRKKLRKIINIKIETSTKIIIFLVLTLISIAYFFYKSFNYIKIDRDFIISVFIIIAFLIILGNLIKQTVENNKLVKEYDNLLEFMTTFEMEIEKQRIQRHETKNEFLTIRAKLCDNQKNNEIVNYIDEILQEKIKVKQEEYAKFGYLPANGIKGLCYYKVQEAENKGINISLNISKKIKGSPINKLNTREQKEFGKILGVLLDNAIEASQNSKDKKIGIEFYSKSYDDFKMIISNTYSNVIDKDKIGKEKFSTKGKNRGHGLLLVKHIINNNSMFELNTEVRDNLYIQTVKIKKV